SFCHTLTDSYSGSTISDYINGMRVWHTVHELEWALNNNETDAILKAVSSLTP
ncbi:hypothetical protein PAXRUDRAFT_126928, partial [Paxillus rubicundulus Ve08.2h10]